MNPPAPNETSLPAWPSRRWTAITVAALLFIHAALAIDTLRQKSVTVDEVGHLPAGISYWQKRTFELYHHNPPLVKLLAALPALAANPTVDYSRNWAANRAHGMPLSPWAFGWEFMYANAARYQDIYIQARLPVVGLSILAGVVVFLWSREVFGPAAGLIALALWSFCPNAIAHAGMVTTDLGATSLGFVATYLFWRFLRQPTFLRAAVAGVVLGLAELAKFSSIILFMLWPVLWLVWGLLQRRSHPSPLPRSPRREGRGVGGDGLLSWVGVVDLLVILLNCLFVINLGYFFEGTGTRLGEFQFMSRSLTRPRQVGRPMPAVSPEHPWFHVIVQRQNRFLGRWLAHLPVPLPRHYLQGFDEQKLESEGIEGQGYPVYLRGELRRTGWWWYYFYTLAVKVPLGTWFLSVAALVAAVWRTSARAKAADEMVLLAPVVAVLFVMSFLTDINLGLRYVLPIFPFWFVLVGRVVALVEPRRLGLAAVIIVPLVWNIARCGWIHPDHLAHFNELVGGPKNGYRHLIDSNLDWGQDLLQVEAWLKKNRPGERVGLAYFGNVDPSILATSGRPIRFEIAPPVQLDRLRLVASKPGSELQERRKAWVNEHRVEVQSWLSAEHARGRAVQLSDHPTLRGMAIESIGVGDGPKPGLFAISANFVAGLPFRLRDQSGNLWNAEQDAYSYFRTLVPIIQVGYSIFIYEVTPEQANELREKLGVGPVNQP